MLHEKLDYVLAVAEERNLTKAAQRLYISQPTLSMYLNRLEQELGTKLFDRTKTPVVITPAGQYYVQKMKQVALAEQVIREELRTMSHPMRTFVVGIGQVRGNYWLPMVLPAFCRKYPDVHIQLMQATEDIIYSGLQQQKVDLVVGAYPTAAENLVIEELMFEKVFLAASRTFEIIPPALRGQYSFQHLYQAPPERLRDIPFIAASPGNGIYPIYEEIVRSNHLRPRRIISTNNMVTGAKLTAAGLGIQILSGMIFHQVPDVDWSQMDYFIVRGMPEQRRCLAIYHPENAKLALVKDFLAIVRERVLPECQAFYKLE